MTPAKYQFVLFCCIGVINTLVHGSLLVFFVELVQFSVILAHAFSFLAANMASFVLNSFFTFKQPITLSSYIKFLIASAISMGLTLSIAWCAETFFKLHYLVGFTLIIFLVPPFSFLLTKFWVFKKTLGSPSIS